MSVECKVRATYSTKFDTQGQAAFGVAMLSDTLHQQVSAEISDDGSVSAVIVCSGAENCLLNKLQKANLPFPDNLGEQCSKRSETP